MRADATDAPDVDDEMEDEDGRFFGGGLNNEQQVSQSLCSLSVKLMCSKS